MESLMAYSTKTRSGSCLRSRRRERKHAGRRPKDASHERPMRPGTRMRLLQTRVEQGRPPSFIICEAAARVATVTGAGRTSSSRSSADRGGCVITGIDPFHRATAGKYRGRRAVILPSSILY